MTSATDPANFRAFVTTEGDRVTIVCGALDGMNEHRAALMSAYMMQAFQDGLLQIGALSDKVAKQKAEDLRPHGGWVASAALNGPENATVTLLIDWSHGNLTADVLHNGEAARVQVAGDELIFGHPVVQDEASRVRAHRHHLDHFFRAVMHGIRQRLFPTDTPRYELDGHGNPHYLGYPD